MERVEEEEGEAGREAGPAAASSPAKRRSSGRAGVAGICCFFLISSLCFLPLFRFLLPPSRPSPDARGKPCPRGCPGSVGAHCDGGVFLVPSTLRAPWEGMRGCWAERGMEGFIGAVGKTLPCRVCAPRAWHHLGTAT